MKVDHQKDKELLLGLISSLNISKRTLKKDELGYWNLVGKRGFIDTDSEYWYVRVSYKSKRKWRNVKDALKTMVLWQEGDAGGALRLHRHPSEEEAQKIRKICGFTVSRKLSENEKELLRKRLVNKISGIL